MTDLDTQFADGVYLCLLSGLLEGYFVPLYDFHLTPQVLSDIEENSDLSIWIPAYSDVDPYQFYPDP